jgi:hypothetical protein
VLLGVLGGYSEPSPPPWRGLRPDLDNFERRETLRTIGEEDADPLDNRGVLKSLLISRSESTSVENTVGGGGGTRTFEGDRLSTRGGESRREDSGGGS